MLGTGTCQRLSGRKEFAEQSHPTNPNTSIHYGSILNHGTICACPDFILIATQPSLIYCHESFILSPCLRIHHNKPAKRTNSQQIMFVTRSAYMYPAAQRCGVSDKSRGQFTSDPLEYLNRRVDSNHKHECPSKHRNRNVCIFIYREHLRRFDRCAPSPLLGEKICPPSAVNMIRFSGTR